VRRLIGFAGLPRGLGGYRRAARAVVRKLESKAASSRYNEGICNRRVMRNGQNNKRMRGRNNQQHHRKSQNPMSRVYESNGPDVKIRGNPSHIAEKYVQLARDAQSSGDPVSAENYYQHAEHYNRLIAAAQEQFRQQNPHFNRPEQDMRSDMRDDAFEDGDEDGVGQQPMQGGSGDAPFGMREPQPYLPREAQPFPQQQQNNQQQNHQQRPHQGAGQSTDDVVGGLPSFITGGQQPQQAGQPNQGHGSNGHDSQPDRFPLHRRRRRHRGGGRQDVPGGRQGDDSHQE
jgi:hypothetical protein